jgi:hypothetical protein
MFHYRAHLKVYIDISSATFLDAVCYLDLDCPKESTKSLMFARALEIIAGYYISHALSLFQNIIKHMYEARERNDIVNSSCSEITRSLFA